MPATLIVHDTDPAELIKDRAGNLREIEVFNNQVLVGVYQREAESKTAGGIILTDKTTDEDKYQSKVGLILKMGPAAFDDKGGESDWFQGQDMTTEQWVFYRPNAGWNVTLISKDPRTGKKRELLCRLLEDVNILGRITSPMGPDRIY